MIKINFEEIHQRHAKEAIVREPLEMELYQLEEVFGKELPFPVLIATKPAFYFEGNLELVQTHSTGENFQFLDYYLRNKDKVKAFVIYINYSNPDVSDYETYGKVVSTWSNGYKTVRCKVFYK